MRVVFIGAGAFGVETLDALIHAGIEIPLVITQPDRKSGRGRRLTPAPINIAATERNLHVLTAPDINSPEMIEQAAACAADVGVVIDFGQKVRLTFRDVFRGGCVNLHASLLPCFRGAAPYQWALIRGATDTGVTVFRLVDRMDAGNILTRIETPIGKTETAGELHNRLAKLGPRAVLDALKLFEGGNTPDGQPQDDRKATTAPKLEKADGLLVFAAPADAIVRRILGLWPWPGGRCRYVAADGSRDETVTLARARVVQTRPTPAPSGTLGPNLQVAAPDGAFEILEIKPQSGRLMPWPAFVNGRHVRPGDRLLSVRD